VGSADHRARTDGKPPADRSPKSTKSRSATRSNTSTTPRRLHLRRSRANLEGLQKIKRVARERRKRVTTGQMNRFLDKSTSSAPVPMAKRIRIFYMTQAAVAPPTFVLFTDRDIKLHFAFERFLENQIREAFGFEGTPIWFKKFTSNGSTNAFCCRKP
jgi:GTP-binding protein